MKVILDGTDNEAFDPVSDLRVLVAYPNAAFARRAKVMLQRVGQAAGEQGRLIYSLWDFSCLAEPRLLQIATEEALAADIIIFSAPEGKSLPKSVRDWVSRWLLLKKEIPQALVACLHHEESPAPTDPILLRYLASVAECGDMSFFAAGNGSEVRADLAELRVKREGTSQRAGPAVSPQLANRAGAPPGITCIYATGTPAAQRGCRAAT